MLTQFELGASLIFRVLFRVGAGVGRVMFGHSTYRRRTTAALPPCKSSCGTGVRSPGASALLGTCSPFSSSGQA